MPRARNWIEAAWWRAALLGIAWTTAQAGELAPPILRPEQLRPGMRGYGLSVFRGTEPERFEVEILGVLPNAFPKQDLILIRMSGADLEKHKVIAGMSGSPIYIEDKLIGALGYGWAFENEPMAGVTPIHNMLADLQRPPAPPAADRRTELWPTQLPASSVGTLPGVTPSRLALESPRPLVTPLACAGFRPQTLQPWADWLERLGFWPVTAGGGGLGGEADGKGPVALVPGSAMGVQLVRGDFNATAVGTVTHVIGDRVLAFGHPFFQMGT
ncbi:MAG: SpoIVB peptidase S55 domain-containing protein, partial [Verrucomicrobiae bacterium]|nr:SpoIVB peptidase S55 domain-containing protein [Verrucomicrobiae bacterium]